MARRQPLSRDRVLSTALALADKEGIEALSMRRLASELGVVPMALYNHVSNRADLLDGIAEQVFAAVPAADPSAPWKRRVHATALGVHRAMRQHPVVPLAL